MKDTIEIAGMGRQMSEFKNSNVGSYLYARAEQDEINALRELATVDPTDTETIYKLQLKAAVRKHFIEYVEEAIIAGKNAEFSLDSAKDF